MVSMVTLAAGSDDLLALGYAALTLVLGFGAAARGTAGSLGGGMPMPTIEVDE